MRKISLFLFALLFLIGVANATNIPMNTEPKNYPVVWTEEVYANAAVTSGYVVQWDFETSDSSTDVYDDMCPWVKTVATAESPWTAGVCPLGQNIAAGGTGSIIIRGPTPVYMGHILGTTTCTADDFVGSSSAGVVLDWVGGTTDETMLGICIKTTAAANDALGDATADFALIYVQPTMDDD